MGDFHWLAGLIRGDGYIDERHIEIYNSSPTILKKTVQVIKKLPLQVRRIKVDVYSTDDSLILKWSKILGLPKKNVRLKKNTSPWATNSEKVRIRISSKRVATKLKFLLEKKLGENAVRSFLMGLFDAEGSVDLKGYLEFKQVASKRGKILVLKVYRLLRKLGIDCTSPKIKNDILKKDFYFYVKDLGGYAKTINFEDIDKKEKLDFIVKVYKERKKPSKDELLAILREGPKTINEIMLALWCPYYNVRYVLQKLINEGRVSCIKSGNQNSYLVTR